MKKKLVIWFSIIIIFLSLGGLAYKKFGGFWAPKMLVSFLKSPEENLNFTQGRTNVLLLGVGGGNHEGADLTDTMIFASMDIKSGDTVMLSLPRDIWLDSLQAKINTAFHYGGFTLARQAIQEVVGQPIHYTYLVNFEGFTKAIDIVGGIKVNVSQAFDDYQYPIEGRENDECGGDPNFSCRYEHLHFDAGWQQMDGKRALKFVRSRYASGEQGSDFSRSQRQQQVISGLKDKIVSGQTLTNPAKLSQLLGLVKDYVQADPTLNNDELASFANILVRFIRHKSEIRTLSLDTGTEESPGFLVNPQTSVQYQNQWVLVPRGGSWLKFQEYFNQKIKNDY